MYERIVTGHHASQIDSIAETVLSFVFIFHFYLIELFIASFDALNQLILLLMLQLIIAAELHILPDILALLAKTDFAFQLVLVITIDLSIQFL